MGNRKQPTPPPTNQTKPEPPPAPPLRKPSLAEGLYILRQQGYLGLSVADAVLLIYRELNSGRAPHPEEK